MLLRHNKEAANNLENRSLWRWMPYQGSANAASVPLNANFYDEGYVKQTLCGWYCVCLLFCWMSPGRAQEQPPPEPQQQPTPQVPKPPEPPPLPPRPPDVKMPDEGVISVGVWGWILSGQPIFDAGTLQASSETSHLRMPGTPSLGRGANVSIPAGGHNAIRLSYFDTKASGTFVAPINLNFWSIPFSPGDVTDTNYRIRSFKFSYEFVSWPYPIGSRKIRVKTLWQAQVARMSTGFAAPLSTTATTPAAGSKTVVLPTLGLGISYYLAKDLRFDADASGFMIPHHGAIGDVNTAMSYRFSRLELQLGAKLYYFKTSTHADFYMKGLMGGPFIGVKFYLN